MSRMSNSPLANDEANAGATMSVIIFAAVMILYMEQPPKSYCYIQRTVLDGTYKDVEMRLQ